MRVLKRKDLWMILGILIGLIGFGLLFSPPQSLKKVEKPGEPFPLTHTTSLAEARRIELQNLQTWHRGCEYVRAKTYDRDHKAFTAEEREREIGGNPFLLYAYTWIHSYTQEPRYLRLAEEQARCIETAILPISLERMQQQVPRRLRARFAQPEALFWGTYLLALSDFYRIWDGPSPLFLKEIADYLARLSIDRGSILESLQSEIRRVRGLLHYADLSREAQYLERAKEVMQAISVNTEELGHDPYILLQMGRAYCELYSSAADENLKRQIEQFRRESERIFREWRASQTGFAILVFYKLAVSADACWEATHIADFYSWFRTALKKLVAHIFPGDGGIIEHRNRQTISLNAEITRLLTKIKPRGFASGQENGVLCSTASP